MRPARRKPPRFDVGQYMAYLDSFEREIGWKLASGYELYCDDLQPDGVPPPTRTNMNSSTVRVNFAEPNREYTDEEERLLRHREDAEQRRIESLTKRRTA